MNRRRGIGLAAIAFVAALVAQSCGNSSGPNGNTDGGGKLDGSARSIDAATYDFGCGGGSACPLSQVCCTMPGSPLTFGCVDPGSCQGTNKISCDGPDDCGGSQPICCGVDVPDGTGTYPQCSPASLGTSCTSAAACSTHLGTSCTDTTKVQLCHVSADCTDASKNKCCTFVSGGASLTFCIDQATAGLAGATCH